MKYFAPISLLVLTMLYLVAGAYAFMMSVFCFDSGTKAENWQCFFSINSLFILPALAAIVIGVVLLFRRRDKTAILVGSIPAMLLAALFIAMIAFAP